MASRASMAPFFAIMLWLVGLDVLSWIRTGPLRRGTTRRARDPPAAVSFASSRVTFVPSLAGMAAAAWGAARMGTNALQALVLVTAGVSIALAGVGARVRSIRADQDGVVVRLAWRLGFRASWHELRAVIPPASPLGGWRLVDAGGKRSTLMPSDLWGHEGVLELIVIRAALRFDGRRWSAPSARDDPGVSPLAGRG